MLRGCARRARSIRMPVSLYLYNEDDFLLVDRLFSSWLLIVVYLCLVIHTFFPYSLIIIISDSYSSYALTQTRPTESVYGYKDPTR